MQVKSLKIQGGYQINIRDNGGNIILEVFSPEGWMVDFRKFSHKDLTGEENPEQRAKGYSERGW